MASDIKIGSHHKLWFRKFKLNTRGEKITRRSMQYWLRLPGEVVESLCLQVFRTWLDKAMADLFWYQAQFCFRQGGGLKTFRGPYQATFLWFCNSMMRFFESIKTLDILGTSVLLKSIPLYLSWSSVKWILYLPTSQGDYLHESVN